MENYLSILQSNSEFAQNEFSELSDDQFNFKPAPDKWSAAQCMLHLVKSNKGYFPLYDQLVANTFSPNFFEKAGWFAGFWGKFLVKSVDPNNIKKMRAPSVLRPGQSHIDKSIIDKFVIQNKKIADYYTVLQSKNLEKIIISSPFAKVIVYNAACSFDIIVLHEQRHLQQAKRAAALAPR